jgi:hypothetical protein
MSVSNLGLAGAFLARSVVDGLGGREGMPIGSAMLALHTELVVTMKPVYQVKFEQLDVAASGKWT